MHSKYEVCQMCMVPIPRKVVGPIRTFVPSCIFIIIIIIIIIIITIVIFLSIYIYFIIY